MTKTKGEYLEEANELLAQAGISEEEMALLLERVRREITKHIDSVLRPLLEKRFDDVVDEEDRDVAVRSAVLQSMAWHVIDMVVGDGFEAAHVQPGLTHLSTTMEHMVGRLVAANSLVVMLSPDLWRWNEYQDRSFARVKRVVDRIRAEE